MAAQANTKFQVNFKLEHSLTSMQMTQLSWKHSWQPFRIQRLLSALFPVHWLTPVASAMWLLDSMQHQ